MFRFAIAVCVVFTSLLTNAFSQSTQPVKKPLKVFILAGQSNMQGHAQVSTIDAMQYHPAAAPLLSDIRSEDGTLKVCDQVWIASLGSAADERTGKLTAGFGAEGRGPKIGPEFAFGIYIEKLLNEPVLIIKTAWGGKSLNTDFRPPSAGPYEFTEQQIQNFEKQNKDVLQIKAEKEQATGVYYRQMIEYVKSVLGNIPKFVPEYDQSQGYELAGFVWFQGWNDMVDGSTYPQRDQPGGYDQYSSLLAEFIRDVRNDLDTPELPFVIGVMGVGGPTELYGPDQKRYKSTHQNFRDAMAAPARMPEFKDTVINVMTEDAWDLQVTKLRDREKSLKPKLDAIKEKVKAGNLTKAMGDEETQNLYAETFDDKELAILKTSVSNAEFHYLGSATIMVQIGKRFAEAMAMLQE